MHAGMWPQDLHASIVPWTATYGKNRGTRTMASRLCSSKNRSVASAMLRMICEARCWRVPTSMVLVRVRAGKQGFAGASVTRRRPEGSQAFNPNPQPFNFNQNLFLTLKHVGVGWDLIPTLAG